MQHGTPRACETFGSLMPERQERTRAADRLCHLVIVFGVTHEQDLVRRHAERANGGQAHLHLRPRLKVGGAVMVEQVRVHAILSKHLAQQPVFHRRDHQLPLDERPHPCQHIERTRMQRHLVKHGAISFDEFPRERGERRPRNIEAEGLVKGAHGDPKRAR